MSNGAFLLDYSLAYPVYASIEPLEPEAGWDEDYVPDVSYLSNGRRMMTSPIDETGFALTKTVHSGGERYAEISFSGATPEYGEIKVEAYDGVNYSVIILYLDSGDVEALATVTPTFAAIVSGDVVGIAVDMDNGKVWFRVNGGDWNENPAHDPTSGAGGFFLSTYPPFNIYVEHGHSAATVSSTLTTGPTFVDAAPSGFDDWYTSVATATATIDTQAPNAPITFQFWGGDGASVVIWPPTNTQVEVSVGRVTIGGDITTGVGDYPEGFMFDMGRWMG